MKPSNDKAGERMEKRITFFSNGVPLAGYVTLPDEGVDAAKLLPTIVLCHGHSRYCNDGLDALAGELATNGFAVLRFDFRGCGRAAQNRYHLYCATEWPEDLRSAISFAQTLPYVDPDRIAVAGISMGASTAVYTAGIDPRIRAVVSMAGIADCGEWLADVWRRSNGDWSGFSERIRQDQRSSAATGHSQIIPVLDMYNETEQARQALTREVLDDPDINAYQTLDSLANLILYKPIAQCANIHCPILFVHGAQDTLVPERNAHTMYDAVASTQKQRKVYEAVEHNIPRDPNRATVFHDIVDWFLSHL